MSSNPLLVSSELPPFSEILPEHVVPAVKDFTEKNLAALEQQLDALSEPTWESLVAVLEERDDQLSKAWSPVSHLNLVRNSPELREAHEAALALLSPYHTAFGQNARLCQSFQHLADSPAFSNLNQAQQTTIEHALRDFKLSGIDLPKEKQTRYGEIKAQLSKLTSQFSNNVLDATQAWFFHTEDKAQLSGIPESILAGAKATAEKKSRKGWSLSLDGPVYMAVMTYADSRELRETMYLAYNSRASEVGPNAGEWDNGPLITDILALRQELAILLGFNNYSELSLATKMAESPEQVQTFLRELAAKARPAAEKDLAELKTWVEETFSVTDLQHWDISYYSEKLRQEKYSVSQDAIKQYFTLPKVLKGLFDVANKLFGIEVKETATDGLWHEDARYFEIYKSGEKVAAFYMDLFAREGKRGGAWMDVCRTRRQTEDGLQLPVAYLVCNFAAPNGDKPALLMHSDVTTLFHEFGHGLHHMMTQVDVAAVSGISGVEWDAVELPSQFLENWCWQPEVLAELSAHVDTGEALPESLIEKMLAAKNFQSGMFLLRQIEFGLFDITLHAESSQPAFPGVQALLNQIREEIAVVQPPATNRFQNSFSHIFAGGYAAGYYSYLWAELLSADAFSAFEENGIFDTKTGTRFLDCILAKGGSLSAAQLFKSFRGREPSIDALLRHSGIRV